MRCYQNKISPPISQYLGPSSGGDGSLNTVMKDRLGRYV